MIKYSAVFVTAILLAALSNLTLTQAAKQGIFGVWLTVRAEDHFLEVIWENASYFWNDQVIITNAATDAFELVYESGRKMWKPTNADITHSTFDLDDINYRLNTKLHFDYAAQQGTGIEIDCYQYWATVKDYEGTTLGTSCLKMNAHWMNDLRDVIGNYRLRDLFIPGTHNSASYLDDGDVHSLTKTATLNEWSQDNDVYGQLVHGARYLDIHVGYYPELEEKFYIQHGTSRQRSLYEIARQVKTFVTETKEIVIFDLHSFPVGFTSQSPFKMLVRLLQIQFEELIVQPPLTWNNTLNEIWSVNQLIILTCNDNDIVKKYRNVFFGSIEQRWSSSRKWSQLRSHIRKIKSYDPRHLNVQPVAMMAVLSLDKQDVENEKLSKSRLRADNINRDVSALMRKEVANNVNIVVVDFILGTTLVQTAIENNKLH